MTMMDYDEKIIPSWNH